MFEIKGKLTAYKNIPMTDLIRMKYALSKSINEMIDNPFFLFISSNVSYFWSFEFCLSRALIIFIKICLLESDQICQKQPYINQFHAITYTRSSWFLFAKYLNNILNLHVMSTC